MASKGLRKWGRRGRWRLISPFFRSCDTKLCAGSGDFTTSPVRTYQNYTKLSHGAPFPSLRPSVLSWKSIAADTVIRHSRPHTHRLQQVRILMAGTIRWVRRQRRRHGCTSVFSCASSALLFFIFFCDRKKGGRMVPCCLVCVAAVAFAQRILP